MQWKWNACCIKEQHRKNRTPENLRKLHATRAKPVHAHSDRLCDFKMPGIGFKRKVGPLIYSMNHAWQLQRLFCNWSGLPWGSVQKVGQVVVHDNQINVCVRNILPHTYTHTTWKQPIHYRYNCGQIHMGVLPVFRCRVTLAMAACSLQHRISPRVL